MISNVKLIQLLSAGADHIPFSEIPSGITIAGNAGAYAEPMAEHVLAMILAIFKNLTDRHNKLVNGIFDHTHQNRMLKGSACAILGFGGIGRAAARLLQCFGVRILAINSSGRTEEPVEFVGTLKDLEYVLRLADIALIALPLTNSTRGLIGSRELGWMKNDALIINVARGEIIDEAALYEKLRLNPNFSAAIDAWWVEPFRGGQFRTQYPLLTLPNVLGSPHNSGLVPNSLITGATYAAENVKRFLNHQPIVGVIRRTDYS
jgi:glycerate dehydrogenase